MIRSSGNYTKHLPIIGTILQHIFGLRDMYNATVAAKDENTAYGAQPHLRVTWHRTCAGTSTGTGAGARKSTGSVS